MGATQNPSRKVLRPRKCPSNRAAEDVFTGVATTPLVTDRRSNMRRRPTLVMVITICPLTVFLAGCAMLGDRHLVKVSQDHVDALRAARVVRIVLEPSGAMAEADPQHLEDIQNALRVVFECAGVKTVPSDATAFDASLVIEMKGYPLSASYAVKPKREGATVTHHETLYTGASVEGKIRLDVPSLPAHVEEFKGMTLPAPRVYSVEHSRDPADAPFHVALGYSSCLSKVLQLVARSYGPDPLVRAFSCGRMSWGGTVSERNRFHWDALDTVLRNDAACGVLLAALHHEDVRLRRGAVEALSGLTSLPTAGDGDGIPYFSSPSVSESYHQWIWERTPVAQKTLQDSRIAEALASALADEDSFVRLRAARVLGRLALPRATESLAVALSDEEPDVREAAVDALRWLGDPRAVSALIKALVDRAPSVRWKAASALAKTSDTRAVQPLITALSDEEPNVREWAAEALGEIGDPRAVHALTIRLADEEPTVRWRTASALGKLRDARAINALVTTLDDEQPGVRRKAAEALGRIGEPQATGPLAVSLRDKDSDVRTEAAAALQEIGDSRAVEPLIIALERATSSREADVMTEALREISGQKFGAKPARWRKWWLQNQAQLRAGKPAR